MSKHSDKLFVLLVSQEVYSSDLDLEKDILIRVRSNNVFAVVIVLYFDNR